MGTLSVVEAQACGPQAGAGMCGECGEGTPGSVDKDLGGLFLDITASVGFPALKSQSASVGDLDGDGYPDILVTSDKKSRKINQKGKWVRFRRPDVWMSCGGRRFVRLKLKTRVYGEKLLRVVSASHLEDMDGDGRTDIVLAGRRTLQVLYQRPGFTFEAHNTSLLEHGCGAAPLAKAQPSALAIYDFDGDGRLDIYVGLKLKEKRVQQLQDGEATTPDALLLGTDEPGVWTPATALPPALTACGEGQTLALSVISRQAFGLLPLLYVGRDFGPDCLLAMDGLKTATALELPEAGAGELGSWATMGVDHTFWNGNLILGTSDWGALHLMAVGESEVADMGPQIDQSELTRIYWGLKFVDSNLDAIPDLVTACGHPVMQPGSGALFETVSTKTSPKSAWLLNSLRYFEGAEASGWMTLKDRSVAAGPTFTPGELGTDEPEQVSKAIGSVADLDRLKRDYYELLTADFDRDGCPDLLTTPVEQYVAAQSGEGLSDDLEYASNTSIRILRNRCNTAGKWMAFELPHSPGAMVIMESADGRRIEQARASGGISGVAEPNLVRFGLGEAPAPIDSLQVRWVDGTLTRYPVAGLAPGHIYRLSR